MLVVTAKVCVRPDAVAEFEALAGELWALSHRDEPGLHRYEYVRGTEPGHYLTLMVFDDHDAFIVHQASAHHVELAGRMRPLIESVEVEYGQPVDVAFGHGPRGGDPVQVDGATREHYLERYPPPEATWWK